MMTIRSYGFVLVNTNWERYLCECLVRVLTREGLFEHLESQSLPEREVIFKDDS